MASGLDPDFFGQETNPYAPPSSQLEQRKPAGSPTTVPFDVGSILGATWTIYKERLGYCMSVCWTAVVIMWGVQFLQNRVLHGHGLANGVRSEPFLVTFAVFFGGYIFNTWLGIGQNLAMLSMARREAGAFEQLFRGGRFILTSIVAVVLFMMTIGLIMIVNLVWIPIVTALLGRGHPASIGVFVVAVAIACVFAIYISTRFSQFNFFIIDQSVGAMDSLSWSWEATRGRAGTLVVIYAMMALINLGGFLACFVGLLFTIPFSMLMLAVAYLSLTGQPVGSSKRAPGSWDEISFLDERE